MTGEIDWRDIKIGEKYKYEEKYELQLIVKVINKKVLNDETHNDFYRFKIKILEVCGGIATHNHFEGKEIWVGKSLNSDTNYLTNHMKFKTLDSDFSYATK